jgi:hypothetical protein
MSPCVRSPYDIPGEGASDQEGHGRTLHVDGNLPRPWTHSPGRVQPRAHTRRRRGSGQDSRAGVLVGAPFGGAGTGGTARAERDGRCAAAGRSSRVGGRVDQRVPLPRSGVVCAVHQLPEHRAACAVRGLLGDRAAVPAAPAEGHGAADGGLPRPALVAGNVPALRCSLYTGSGIGERFGQRQMEDVKSALSENGREVAESLEQRVNQPVFYFLNRTTETKTERQRRCPSCGGAWLLKEPWGPYFDFRCRKCRLVSNVAWGCQ